MNIEDFLMVKRNDERIDASIFITMQLKSIRLYTFLDQLHSHLISITFYKYADILSTENEGDLIGLTLFISTFIDKIEMYCM